MDKQEKNKVDKYLTDIKELPPESEPEIVNPKLQGAVKLVTNPSLTQPDKQKADNQLNVKTPAEVVQDDIVFDESEVNQTLPFTSRDIILGVINLITAVLLIIFLVKLPQKADELKNLRIEKIKNDTGGDVNMVELEERMSRAGNLDKLFLNQSGIVDFVNEVEKLKTEEGAIRRVAFASQKPVKDKIGYFGIPVVIELSGTWEAIGTDLQKIQGLPFLFRTVSVSAEHPIDNPGVIEFKYGGLLYVSDDEIIE